MWLAEASEYIVGLSLGVVVLMISCLLLIPPHPSPVFERRPTPPPSRSPSPETPAITEPYNEDEIGFAMKAIYDILIRLDQITPDQLVYPPVSGHSINTELCESLNLDPRVISLMKRLTYPKSIQGSFRFDFIEESRALVYTEDEDINTGRDPENGGIPEALRLDYLLPTDIVLTEGSRYGTNLILDTQASWRSFFCSLQLHLFQKSVRRSRRLR